MNSKTHVMALTKKGIKKYLVRVVVRGVPAGEINAIGGYFYLTDFKKNATAYSEKYAAKLSKSFDRAPGEEYSIEPINQN